MRTVELIAPEEADQWHFIKSLDLEVWLPAISTQPGEGQDNDGTLVCAFDQDNAPSVRHGKMMAASFSMYKLLKEGLPTLKAQAESTQNQALLEQCVKMEAQLLDIDAEPIEDIVRPAW